jgi:hypothetical protein
MATVVGRVPRPTSLTVLLAALLAVLALAAPARAAQDQRTIFDAPRDLLDASKRDASLDELQSLGVQHLRVVLYWKNVAPEPESRIKPKFDPTDPAAYAWGSYEALIRAARERGLGVLLTPSGPVPRWATNGAKDQLTRPSPNEFRMFMTALARKFGDDVETWSIWNEPNHPDFLLPHYDAADRAVSPRIYRGLYAAAIRGLDAAGNTAPVLMGETAPIGGGRVVSPLRFLRGALCLDERGRRVGRCGKLRVDGIALHPYTRKAGPYFEPANRDDVTIGVLSRAVRFLRQAEKAKVLDRGTGLHLTEFGIQSLPDPLVGVPQQRQEEFRAISEKLAYDEPRVKTFSQYLLTDDDPDFDAPRIARYPRFETGLRGYQGKAKIAFEGFRLPLVARTSGSRASLWGLVRPGSGPRRAEVQRRDRGGDWRTVGEVTTDAAGYWTLRTAARKGREWRVRWTAPSGTTFTGAPTRALPAPR